MTNLVFTVIGVVLAGGGIAYAVLACTTFARMQRDRQRLRELRDREVEALVHRLRREW